MHIGVLWDDLEVYDYLSWYLKQFILIILITNMKISQTFKYIKASAVLLITLRIYYQFVNDNMASLEPYQLQP